MSFCCFYFKEIFCRGPNVISTLMLKKKSSSSIIVSYEGTESGFYHFIAREKIKFQKLFPMILIVISKALGRGISGNNIPDAIGFT